jgi:hypothetical protein
MASAWVSTLRPAARLWSSARHRQPCLSLARAVNRRPLMSFLRRVKETVAQRPDPVPTLLQDNLFHPFSKSPFPAIKARGEAISKLAPCPVCAAESSDVHASPKAVKFECPDCGWPTHCLEEHWASDEEHKKYCSRLREVNEDEHDIRSGRRIWEFEFPGMLHRSRRMFRLRVLSGQQALNLTKRQFHSQIGTCSGTPGNFPRWIRNGPGDMSAKCSRTQSQSAPFFINTAASLPTTNESLPRVVALSLVRTQ